MPKRRAQPKSRLNLAIDPSLYERLASAAGEGGTSITAWIVDAVIAKLHERRQYITLDPQGQLATGPDWDAMAEGQRQMEQALARDKAREEESKRAHYQATHCDTCDQDLSYDDCGCMRKLEREGI